MKNVSFDQIVYGYAAESTRDYDVYPNKLKVFLPDLFPDKNHNEPIETKINNGSAKNIIINNKKPAISDFTKSRNYLKLKILNRETIHKNDKLLIAFVYSNPKNGNIIGKAD